MIKEDIVLMVARETGVPKTQTREVVNKLFDTIIEVLLDKERVKILDFGIFEIKHRSPKTSYNPRTGEPVSVPARLAATFTPSPNFKKLVQEGLED